MSQQPIIDVYLVAAGQFHDIDFARVERKDAVKTRIRRSTDYADALALAIYEPPKPGMRRY